MSSESAKLGESMETSVKPEADRMKPMGEQEGGRCKKVLQETQERRDEDVGCV